uniref:Uncharacterized protein n=1 Tax=Lactuca sativa TaxID=4236 RepID=A0A9R1URR3_LACSA|nr:hypothetical protein LSAT_V11C800435500 [Lactuca sativa]
MVLRSSSIAITTSLSTTSPLFALFAFIGRELQKQKNLQIYINDFSAGRCMGTNKQKHADTFLQEPPFSVCSAVKLLFPFYLNHQNKKETKEFNEPPINEYVQSCDIVAFNKICKFIHAKKIIVIIFLVIDDGIGCVVIAEFLLDLVGQKKDAGGWFCGVVIYVVCSCVDHEGSLLLVVLSVC